MLDTVTLRVAFGLVASCVLVLFYVSTYRSTRSAYCAWWCVSLALFILGALLYLLDGSGAQVVANPLGNAVTTAGSAAVWAGARSLRGRAGVRWWQLAAGPLVVLGVSWADDPVDDVWTGGPAFPAVMALLLGAAGHQLRRCTGELRGGRGFPAGAAGSDPQYVAAVVVMQWVSFALAGFYLLRAAVFVVVGPEHLLFEAAFGSQVTTLLTLSMLVVVTHTMAIVTHRQQTGELHARATRDALTGLLNRGEIVRRLEAALRDGDAAVLIADLDGFKGVNDHAGHAAGDRALELFAAVAEAATGPGDAVGRLGGDEFAVVVVDSARAEDVAERIRRDLRGRLAGDPGGADLTVSIGVATGAPGADVADVLHQADVALYRAKTAGRDRAVRYDGGVHPPPPAGRRTVRGS